MTDTQPPKSRPGGRAWRTYQTLDAMLIVGVLILLAVGGGMLVFIDIPQANLPIVASLLSSLGAVIAAYTGYRWAQKKSDEPNGG